MFKASFSVEGVDYREVIFKDDKGDIFKDIFKGQ